MHLVELEFGKGVEMFSGKGQGETRKRRKVRIKELKSHLEKLKHHLKQRQNHYGQAWEAYKQSVAGKWEYLQVSDKDIKKWGDLNRLGVMGWELAGISTFVEDRGFVGGPTIYTLYVFKRRIPGIPDALLSEFADIPETESEIKQIESEILGLQSG